MSEEEIIDKFKRYHKVALGNNSGTNAQVAIDTFSMVLLDIAEGMKNAETEKAARAYDRLTKD